MRFPRGGTLPIYSAHSESAWPKLINPLPLPATNELGRGLDCSVPIGSAKGPLGGRAR